MTSRLDGLVLAPVDRQEHALRAEAAGRPQRHRRVDAERARLVRRRRDDAALVGSAAADDDRASAQLRPVALLDGREERVEVDVEDYPLAHARDSRPPPRQRCATPVHGTHPGAVAEATIRVQSTAGGGAAADLL